MKKLNRHCKYVRIKKLIEDNQLEEFTSHQIQSIFNGIDSHGISTNEISQMFRTSKSIEKIGTYRKLTLWRLNEIQKPEKCY